MVGRISKVTIRIFDFLKPVLTFPFYNNNKMAAWSLTYFRDFL